MATRNLDRPFPRRRRQRAALTAASGLVLAALLPPNAARAGGGDWLSSGRDRYEPAEDVTTLPTAPPPTTATPNPSLAPASDEATPAVRTVSDTGGGISGEVVAWLAGLGLLLVVWCVARRLRPLRARIVVRQVGDPRRPGPGTAVDDPEPVRIEL